VHPGDRRRRRELLEAEGPPALTMRGLGERLGIRAPSLYKHLSNKAALEVALIADGFHWPATPTGARRRLH
jgi:AcrR family transcriptional regulator